MAARNVRSKSRRRRANRPGKLRSIHRQLDHVANDTATKVGVPNDPPSISLGCEITKIIEYQLYDVSGATTPFINPGSLVSPGSINFTGTSTDGWRTNIADSDVAKAILAQGLGFTGTIPANHAFAIKKVVIWGPLSDANARAELAIQSTDTEYVARVVDSGTRTSRPKAALSIARLRWFVGTSSNVSINIGIGALPGFVPQSSGYQPLGIVHITVHFRAQGIISDTAASEAMSSEGRMKHNQAFHAENK